ncbi:hypothetical protein E4U60_007461 [Claviceps pazoutovae]|uniref:IBR domain-containing protein n=1 Tax=Claviceps pazoutovae TaxID=1649127 RepID=A0A9P7MF89_9HYPO|nr:hypothetical protein E4U60_007461 [Claviceps pazoutovae]
MDLDMDQESLALAIELQLQDLQRMHKGKHAVGQNPDSEVAARFMEAEFRNLASFHADRVLSRSITQAVATDGDAIVAHARQEQQAANDRALALRDSEQTGPNRRRRGSPSRGASQSRFADDVFPSAAGPSRVRAGPSSAPRARVELRNCVACTSDVPVSETIRCPCSHDYCRDCMTALFNAAISDESLFPPRCCKEPIPIDRSRPFLSASLLGLYEAKKLEHETPNKTYCYVPNCSAFVPPAFVRDDVATCVRCRSRTCTMCKGQMHTQRDCPADTATAEVLQMADLADAVPNSVTYAASNGSSVVAHNGTRIASWPGWTTSWNASKRIETPEAQSVTPSWKGRGKTSFRTMSVRIIGGKALNRGAIASNVMTTCRILSMNAGTA